MDRLQPNCLGLPCGHCKINRHRCLLEVKSGYPSLRGNNDVKRNVYQWLMHKIGGCGGMRVVRMSLMKIAKRNPQRRRALSRCSGRFTSHTWSSAQAKSSAPRGGGTCRVFRRPRCILASMLFKLSRQRASWRVGFVLILLITLRLGLIYTRLNNLRAINSNLPVGVSSVLIVCRVCLLFLSFLFVLIYCPVSVAKRYAVGCGGHSLAVVHNTCKAESSRLVGCARRWFPLSEVCSGK